MTNPSDIVSRANDEYEPVLKWALFSGGDDSLVTTHMLMEKFDFDAVLHLNTGIGVQKTREYVRSICDNFGWPLIEYRADEYVGGDGNPAPQIYEELVKEIGGFHGPPQHGFMFQRLKERPLNQAVREHKTDWFDKILLGTGVYKGESDRRFRNYENPIDQQGAKVWVNPCLYWTESDFQDYRKQHDLPRNPVSKKICQSGECMCGAFAKWGQLSEIKLVDPDLYDRIRRLEESIDCPWGWEEGKSKQHRKPQNRNPNQAELQICSNCIEPEVSK